MKEENGTLAHFKANKAQFGMSTVNQTAVKNFLNNANTTDEMIQEIADACGYTEDSAPATAPAITGVDVVNVTVETANNGSVEVPCYALPVKKWDISKTATLTAEQQEIVAKARAEGRYVQLKGKGPIVRTPVLKADLSGSTVLLYHELFSHQSVRESIKAGDIVYVRKDSVDRLKSDRYTAYSGAILEASNEAMQEARQFQIERELALAELDSDAQKLVADQSAQNQAQAFLAKYGK